MIRKIAHYPQRYIGLFRPTLAKGKIIQNLLQSHEVRFGDAFEALIDGYLKELGFKILKNNLLDSDGSKLKVNHLFSNGNDIFFVEQKIRDDHDESKKRGEIDSFKKKIVAIKKKFNGKKIKGFFYFIDSSFTKNKKFYREEIEKLSNIHIIPLHLSYGKDFFKEINKENAWEEILNHLKEWKETVHDLPEINFDENPCKSFDEIKELKHTVLKKLFSNQNLDDLLHVLFPEGKTLVLLSHYFLQEYQNNGIEKYNELHDLCSETTKRLKNRPS